MDQAFSQIQSLFKASVEQTKQSESIYLVTEKAFAFVLSPGKNRIFISKGVFTENVGIIPLRGEAVISTKGLEWDVQEWHTSIGGQLSTSNHIKSELVELETDQHILFTMELLGHDA
jgi:thiamine pyrophosphokinase